MLGVDILGAAVEEAQRNAAVNRLGHCSYITGNVEDAVPRMVQAAKHEEVSNSMKTFTSSVAQQPGRKKEPSAVRTSC